MISLIFSASFIVRDSVLFHWFHQTSPLMGGAQLYRLSPVDAHSLASLVD